jgi:hypothetical protein
LSLARTLIIYLLEIAMLGAILPATVICRPETSLSGEA